MFTFPVNITLQKSRTLKKRRNMGGGEEKGERGEKKGEKGKER